MIILVVEDDDSTSQVIKMFLEEEYEVVVKIAKDIPSGIKFIENIKPDIIILDYYLSDGNAFEIVQRMKQIYQDSSPPIILMSATSRADFIITQIHPHVYLRKPFDLSHLTQAIEKLH